MTQLSPDLQPLIVIAVMFLLSLLGAYVLFKFLKSTRLLHRRVLRAPPVPQARSGKADGGGVMENEAGELVRGHEGAQPTGLRVLVPRYGMAGGRRGGGGDPGWGVRPLYPLAVRCGPGSPLAVTGHIPQDVRTSPQDVRTSPQDVRRHLSSPETSVFPSHRWYGVCYGSMPTQHAGPTMVPATSLFYIVVKASPAKLMKPQI